MKEYYDVAKKVMTESAKVKRYIELMYDVPVDFDTWLKNDNVVIQFKYCLDGTNLCEVIKLINTSALMQSSMPDYTIECTCKEARDQIAEHIISL